MKFTTKIPAGPYNKTRQCGRLRRLCAMQNGETSIRAINRNIFGLLGCLSMLLFVVSCGSSSVPPHEVYESKFDPKKIDRVEMQLDEIAKKWDMTLFRKDRDSMRYLSQDIDAFFTCFYFEDECVLAVSTVGTPKHVQLMSLDFGVLPISKLEKLTSLVAKDIEVINGSTFVKR